MSRTGAMSTDRPIRPDRSPATLASLSAAAAAGDEAAFAEIHRRLSPGLLRWLTERTGGRADAAEELLQKTWVVAWEALRGRKYDPARSAITTYVYAITHKVWLQYVRATTRGAKASGELEAGWEAGGDEPVSVAEMAELLQAVRDCLNGVGKDSLTTEEGALAKAVMAGHSDRSLAKLLGLAASTTNVKKKSVLEKVRRYLAVRGHRGFGAERGGGEEQ